MQSGTYRAYYFLAPSGDVVALTHEWREATRSFVGSAELGGGVKMLAEDRFIDADMYEWTITVQDPAQQLLTRMHARVHRIRGSGGSGAS